MDSMVKVYIQRAENELRLAKAIFNLSKNLEVKRELGANDEDTFYSATISHAYYSIFYSAKALLLAEGLVTKAPEIHKKTFDLFKSTYVDTGKLDLELLKIYKEMIVRADELLGLFQKEKWKRGHFTYKTIVEANIPFAEESLENARKFVQNIFEVIRKKH